MSNDLPLIPVDFGNCDEDGAVRLVTRGAQEAIKSQGLIFREGLPIKISDDELSGLAHVTFREGMWVAVVDEWLAAPEAS